MLLTLQGLPDFFRHVLNMAKLGVEHLPEQYFKADSDSVDLEREIEGMEKHSLLKRDREKVHRLLDGAIRMEGKFFFPPKKDQPTEEEKEQRKQDHAPILENVLGLIHGKNSTFVLPKCIRCAYAYSTLICLGN